jgi:hypothetical protein
MREYKEPVYLKRYKEVYYDDISEKAYVKLEAEFLKAHTMGAIMEIALPIKPEGMTFEEYILTKYSYLTQSIPSDTREIDLAIYNESILLKFTEDVVLEIQHTPENGYLTVSNIRF